MNIVGTKPLMAAIVALRPSRSWPLTDFSGKKCFYTAKTRTGHRLCSVLKSCRAFSSAAPRHITQEQGRKNGSELVASDHTRDRR
jgi:hypothetical protein